MTFEHLMDLRFNAGKEEGIDIGEKRGEKKGEDKLNKLYTLLIEQKRMEDLKKATEDEAFRKQLYQEFELDE